MAKKALKKKRAYKKRTALVTSHDSFTDTFEIEVAPPPVLRGADPQRLRFLAKLKRTVEIVQPNQAFIIPSKFRNSGETWLKRNYPDFRFTFSAIPDNKEAVRVYKFDRVEQAPKRK